MTENASIKVSACRSLAPYFGEPDHEQNRRDLESWSNLLDEKFMSKWDIDPRNDLIDAARWSKVGDDEYLPSPYRDVCTSWRCTRRHGARLNHLGLQGKRGAPLVEVSPSSIANTQGQITPISDTAEDGTRRPSSPSPAAAAATTTTATTSTSSSSPTSFQQSSPRCSLKRKQQTIPRYYRQTKRKRTVKRQLLP